MKILAEKVVETVVNRICDICNDSVMIEMNGHTHKECGELKASWGYGSKADGITYGLDLCENYFEVALHALKDYRRSIVMFDEKQELPDKAFGIATKGLR
ncbi:LOW QUALITY PROTEIN: conserved hypothetical protein [Paraglaciecola polaris LMG 21857]|uniref:Uncharacterized protein n=2 Tax=Paraglaciecola polaris TaxID=222814 RepID=K6ZX98_9ALTE|nr:LOW QUALITY PROTEIN: conserved hypothetical protein [Paraglaciecola polaris LMG 21857]